MYIAVIGAAAALLRSVFPFRKTITRSTEHGGIDLFGLFPPPQSNTVPITYREKVVILFSSVYLEMGRQLALKAHIEKIKGPCLCIYGTS